MIKYYAFEPIEYRDCFIGHERIEGMKDEIAALHNLHFEETEGYSSLGCDPDYDRMIAYEKAGQFVVFTVRDINGDMVGYLQYFVLRDLHSKGTHVGREDAFFIRKDKRVGALASKLMQFAEDSLRKLGCKHMYMTSKAPAGGPDIGKLLMRKGYKAIATYYTKELEK